MWKVAQEEGMTIGCGKFENESWMSNTPRVSLVLAGGKTFLVKGKTMAWDPGPVSD